jgi:tRNA A37 threonylcarbamoyladenosine synthetase subunit TsaC/SUA5/YrdC
MPLHPIALEICRQLGPMAASAATIVGGDPPLTLEQALGSLVDDVDAACDVGEVGTQAWSDFEDPQLASTVVDLSTYPAAVVRPGSLSTERVEAVLRSGRADTIRNSGQTTD